MTRPRRYEFPGAIHLVTIMGPPRHFVFYDPLLLTNFPENPRSHAPHEQYFETLLWEMCEQYDARVHGYAIDSNCGRVVIETAGAPLAWILHDLLGRYSMYLQVRGLLPDGEKPFPRRYKSQVVEPQKLPYVVRRAHGAGQSADPRHRPSNHPFRSGLIYSERKAPPKAFFTAPTRAALSNLGYLGQASYFDFMARPESPAIAHMLSKTIIGEPRFTDWVTRQCAKPWTSLSLEHILFAVATTILHADYAVAFGSSHAGALARALVAWYAMRTGAAHLGTVGRWLGVTSADLRYLIARHHRHAPELFHHASTDLFPTPLHSSNTVLTCFSRGTPLPKAAVCA